MLLWLLWLLWLPLLHFAPVSFISLVRSRSPCCKSVICVDSYPDTVTEHLDGKLIKFCRLRLGDVVTWCAGYGQPNWRRKLVITPAEVHVKHVKRRRRAAKKATRAILASCQLPSLNNVQLANDN